ncbi:MAG TPA: DUF3090 family protein [Mycobacteriales bacterium]|nr:DUF3090 family protein [Mycobacteriales bacterium]
MTAHARHHDIKTPDRFVVGTVGEPGERSFYLQALAGELAVTVGVEKAEVAALAEGLVVLLDEVRRAGRAPMRSEVTKAAGSWSGGLRGPVEPSFVLDRLTLAWDGEWVVVEAAATETVDVADDDGFDIDESEDEAMETARVLASLDAEMYDVDVPEELEDRDETIASLRVRLTAAQAQAFTEAAQAVVAARRRPCELCGRPVAPNGHFCPRLN